LEECKPAFKFGEIIGGGGNAAGSEAAGHRGVAFLLSLICEIIMSSI
jgi:hypothetical protein